MNLKNPWVGFCNPSLSDYWASKSIFSGYLHASSLLIYRSLTVRRISDALGAHPKTSIGSECIRFLYNKIMMNK